MWVHFLNLLPRFLLEMMMMMMMMMIRRRRRTMMLHVLLASRIRKRMRKRKGRVLMI